MSEVTITAQPDGTFADSTGKKFLPQEKVDTVVQDRLARDREARKDTDATKIAEAERQAAAAKAELATATATIEALKGTSATAEEIVTKVKASHAKIVANIPAEKQKFLPKQLSEADQLAYITENPELFFQNAPAPPVTPDPAIVNKGGGEGRFGGHASLIEFAQRDPIGYAKAQREGKLPKI